MIVTITPNPALDLTYSLSKIDRGESQRVAPAAQRAGGKGINVARVAHQSGHAVTAVAVTGGDTGRSFDSELIASGIRHRLISGTGSTRRSITLFDQSQGETTVLNEEGSRFDSSEWGQLAEAVATLLPQSTCLTASGSLPPGTPEQLYADLVRLAANNDVPIVVDATGAALRLAAEARATVLKPNRRELAEATGQADPVAGAAHLLSLGAGLVVVSLGEEGLIAVSAADPRTVISARHPRVVSGNPTGAGDAVVAALATTIAEGSLDPERMLRRAVAWGAAAVMMPQAGELATHYRELESQTIIERS